MKIQSLKFENLQFGFEGQDPLFEQVDFSFPMNDIVWVKASSGAGRSSLLQLLAGLLNPLKGNYLINDQNVAEMSFEEFLPYRLAIGYGFDFGGVIHNRTLLENVSLPLAYHKICSPEEAQERAEHYFEILGASKVKDKRPSLVPGGMRKLTCLIRALIMEPQVLLLDDPSVGIGQETSLKYFDCIQELRKAGKAQHVFVSSFDEQLMNCLPHREIFLDCGQIYLDVIDGDKKVVSL
ncbi:MAG: ATP-binding cassette domain-containing protein [Pseudobdellovibrionaceae bacterium]